MSQPKLNEQRNFEMPRAPMIKDMGQGILLFLASRASVLGMFPFGMAFFASCFDKSIAYIGITVLAVALMTASAGTLLVKYIVASLLFWIYTRFRSEDNLIKDSVACGISMVIGGGVFLVYGFVGFYDILMLFVEAIVAAIMFIIFKKARYLAESRKKRMQTSQDELISAAVCVGVMITGLSGIILPYNISISNIVSGYAVMSIALNGGIAAAGSGGLCIGFMASMSSSSAVVMMGIFGISALFGNLLKSFGRVGIAMGFLAGSAVSLLYAGAAFTLPVTITEVIVGAFLFVITPNKFQEKLNSFFSPSLEIETIDSDIRVKEYLSMQLDNAAAAFQSLADCFEDASEKRLKSYGKDVATIFDETANRVCEGCPNAAKCWQSDFTRTYRSIMMLLDTIEKNGILSISAVPVSVREKCIRAELFVVEFNHVYELYKKNLVRTGEAVTSRNLVSKQYKEFSALMESMAEEINDGFLFREDMEEEIVSELDKIGITAYEVSVIEGAHGRIEVYLSVAKGSEKLKIEKILTEVLATPMGYETEQSGSVMKFTSKAKYTAEIAVRQISRDYAEVSGDSIDIFKTDDYKQYVIISDGMGSGKRAMLESNITLKLLKEFLKAGFTIRTAIDMINSALCLKLDYECFSTIDLLCIDLMTGICEFYKIGGAESVIMHGSNVETVFSVSLPVGMLPDIKMQGQVKRLADGDIITMMSDGVSEVGFGTVRTEWIKKEIKKPFDTMEEMAQNMIETAVRKSREAVMDDMTIAVIRLVEV